MRPISISRRTIPWLLAAVALLVALGTEVPLRAQAGQWKVLALYSVGRDAAFSIAGERELPRILDHGLSRRLDFYSEYLDAGRFPDLQYRLAFRDFMLQKYRDMKFDVVIAAMDVAVEFLEMHRAELFADTPIVFVSSTRPTRRLPNSAGLIDDVDFAATVYLALALQPDINQVFVVSGAAERDQAIERQARAQFLPLEDRLTFTYLSGLMTSELERQLAALPEQSIAFYLLAYRDGSGENFHPLEYLDRIARFANRPVYSWVDSTIGHGVLGGSMERQEARLEAVAGLALRVLNGEAADSLPISELSGQTSRVDWRQLRRWGISESRVPAGTAIVFREPGALERYRLYILAAGGLLLAQTALIAGLLVQAARRRRAEEAVRRSRDELRRSSEQIRDLGARLLEAQENERARIARELHDDISQQVALLAMDLQLLARYAPNRNYHAEQVSREALERVRDLATSLHDLSHRLHPAKLRLIGLVGALDGLQREVSQSGISVAFSHQNVPPALPHDLSLCVFRVVQEAVQNALKHSAAHALSIELNGSSDALTLIVSDDGSGFDADSAWGQGLGLVSMRERLESIGGTLSIRSGSCGTRVEAIVPLQVTRPAVSVAV
jgi:signal transduction histidine kinase